MITKNVTIKVVDDKATLSDKIILYQHDKGIEILFTVSGFNYKFKKDISIIPSGIDTSRFYRNNLDKDTITSLKKHYKIKDKDYILLAVGRVAPEKSLDYLIKRMPDIVKKHSNIKLYLVCLSNLL